MRTELIGTHPRLYRYRSTNGAAESG